MGGITNTRAFASRYGPRGLGLPLAGLYDAPAEATLRHGLAAAGLGAALEPDGLPTLGFFACSLDLEDELIRALGVEAVEAVIEEAGESSSSGCWRTCPPSAAGPAARCSDASAWSGRKARYASLLVGALQPGRVPEPLAALDPVDVEDALERRGPP